MSQRSMSTSAVLCSAYYPVTGANTCSENTMRILRAASGDGGRAAVAEKNELFLPGSTQAL